MKLSFFYKKTLSSVFITLLLLPFVFFALPPKKTEAFWPVFDWTNVIQNTISAVTGGVTAGATTLSATTNVSQFMKSFVLDTVATAFARALLRKITASTVNWINTGFQGNPAFVTDPGQFFLDVGDRTASQYFLGANSPLNQLCSAFQPQVRLALVKTYLQEDQFNSSCTFSRIGTNFENFTTNFNNGGWEAWFVMTQQSQNNPYGAYLDASKQLSAQVNIQNTKYNRDLLQGKGFLSYEVCPEGKTAGEVAEQRKTNGLKAGASCNANGVGGYCGVGLYCSQNDVCEVDEYSDYDEYTKIAPNDTDCTTAKKTVTPGSVIAEKLTKSLNSTETTLELTNSINQIVNALMNQMVSQVFNSIQGGLRGLSQKQAGQQKTLLEQIQASATEDSFNKEKKSIEATVPATFQPTLTGGEPTPIYTPPTEAEVISKVNTDRAVYACQIEGGGAGADGGPTGSETSSSACNTNSATNNGESEDNL